MNPVIILEYLVARPTAVIVSNQGIFAKSFVFATDRVLIVGQAVHAKRVVALRLDFNLFFNLIR